MTLKYQHHIVTPIRPTESHARCRLLFSYQKEANNRAALFVEQNAQFPCGIIIFAKQIATLLTHATDGSRIPTAAVGLCRGSAPKNRT
jgi:hypothetical protein